MKQLIKPILSKNLRFYRIARSIYRLPALRFRIVQLSSDKVSKSLLGELDNDPYNNIIDDLVAYTGFSVRKLHPYLLRCPRKHFESEFNWYSPKDEHELTWFYRCSSAYLFANAVHPYVSELDIITEGKVLDYGAGIGCNTIGLAKRGIDVDFLEISRLQADFIKFRAERHNLQNVKEVRPYHDGKFDSVLCIQEQYDAIVAMDVLEHIPNYHIVVKRFIEKLKSGGIIIEYSPFDEVAGDIAIHLPSKTPIEEAMVGMERIDKGIWKKKSE